MRRYLICAVVTLAAIAMVAGCAKPTTQFEFEPQRIDEGRWVPKVESFVLIVDDSSSMRRRDPSEKKIDTARNLARSMSRTIPPLDYDAGLRSFGQGGCLPAEETSLLTGMARYSASEFESSVDRFTCADGNSPLSKALKTAGEDLDETSGQVAIIAISDGLDMGEWELKAAQWLAGEFGDRLCIHTIQVGDDPEGERLLTQVAGATECGGMVRGAELTSGAAMGKFVQDALLYPDSDGDGVPDHLDKCPGTPKGVKVDATGCPPDSDGDGVPDHRDKCPNTPKGVKVDADGCPLDSDGDGVPDHLDKCPDTPRGAKVDKDGCTLDSDGDGVPDHLDKCPKTPKGVPVDKNGCPPEGLQAVDGEWVIRGRLLFDTNKWSIKPEARPVLDQAAEFLKKNTQWLVEIQGHTDSTGSMGWNMKLSQNRADSVRDYLVKKGVAASRLTTKGFGPNEPRASNDTREGRAQNRRVDFKPTER